MDEFALADGKTTALFLGTSLVVAITVGAMLVSGWHAGSLDNRIEWVFWAGAILGAAGVASFGVGAFPAVASARGVRRITACIRVGLILFAIAPVLCVIAVMGDYWI